MISFSQTQKKHSMDFSDLIADSAQITAEDIGNDLDVLLKNMNSELAKRFPECSRAFLRTLHTKHSKIRELKKVNRDFCVDELTKKYKECVETWKKLKNEDTCSHLRRD